jgi:hypothetical protein
MAFTAADIESAIEKLGTIEFTDAELEAIAHLLADQGEVEGFALSPGGGRFIVEIAGRLPRPGAPGTATDPMPPGSEGYTATDDLWK